MANEYVNQVGLADGTMLIDLSTDTAQASDVQKGVYFHLPTGQRVQGTCEYDSKTTDADALASEVLDGKIVYVNKNKIVGTMPNNGAVSGNISDKDTPYVVPAGNHNGLGTVGINATEAQKLIPGNIKSGVQILGVTGTYAGEPTTAGAVNVTPYLTSQTILPSSIDKDYISQVNVAEITITRTDNAAGGVTVTIGAVDPAA